MENTLSNAWEDYWQQYSNFGTWQFWLALAMAVLPLVLLYFVIDRRKAFHIGFFGFNVHVWFHYIDTYGVRNGLWDYPYQIIPVAAINFALDASLIPVLFMLLYQWTINHNKNYYVYLICLSIVLSFIFKPLLSALDFLELHKWANYFILFIGYIIIMLVSKWITNLFLYFERKSKALHH